MVDYSDLNFFIIILGFILGKNIGIVIFDIFDRWALPIYINNKLNNYSRFPKPKKIQKKYTEKIIKKTI